LTLHNLYIIYKRNKTHHMSYIKNFYLKQPTFIFPLLRYYFYFIFKFLFI